MINVVLCGGNGTRLWPLSRTLYPKQFNKMMGDRSLFQMTVERNTPLCDQTFIVSNEEQYFLALDHLNELEMKADKFILEPVGRNTAPAIALACFTAGDEELVLVTPSDHVVQNQQEYNRCLEKAKELALKGYMVTFGIKPNYPETGYGYIEADGQEVVSFKEKPDLITAEEYLSSGNYYWNSGMFLFKAGVFLKELELSDADIFHKTRLAFNSATEHYDTIRIPREKMEDIPSNSVDYAVMEHSANVKVIASDIGWSDLGSFEALYEQLPQDEAGNTLTDRYIQVNSSGNLVLSNDRLIASVDVEDLIIVDTPDAIMISRQGSSQKVKEIVNELKLRKSNLCDNHVTAYRPWGNHTELDVSSNYKIKKVVVKPGERLTMQKHFHRNEHWIVVSGTALITVNGERSLLRRNESSFIQMGDEHTVENPGKIDLHLIEVQVGEYVGEDDVIRNQ